MVWKKYNKLDRWRCDHCGKWVKECTLLTFEPEDVKYLGLKSCDEFVRCKECCKNKEYTLDYWKEWIRKRHAKK